VFWFPAWLLRAISGPLTLLQRYGMGAKQPIDIAAAFASEHYQTGLAEQVIQRAAAHRSTGRVMSEPEPVGSWRTL